MTAGLEPHSALPTALPMMFNRFCQALPSALRDIKVLATSAVSSSISLHTTLHATATFTDNTGLGVRVLSNLYNSAGSSASTCSSVQSLSVLYVGILLAGHKASLVVARNPSDRQEELWGFAESKQQCSAGAWRRFRVHAYEARSAHLYREASCIPGGISL